VPNGKNLVETAVPKPKGCSAQFRSWPGAVHLGSTS
jgi:hypothetical protein